MNCVIQFSVTIMVMINHVYGSFIFKTSDITRPMLSDLSERSSFNDDWRQPTRPIGLLSLGHLGLDKLEDGITKSNEKFNIGEKNDKITHINSDKPITDIFSSDNSKSSNETGDKILLEWVQSFLGSTTTEYSVSPNREECIKCSCGISTLPNRIVGGHETAMLQYPWVTYLTYRGNFYCAATVISDRYLLTAAHCVNRFDMTMIRVRLGAHNRNVTSDLRSLEFRVSEVIKHSGYSTSNYNNDIALIKIDDRIDFNGLMKPVCLPERGSTFAGRNAIVTGWGAIAESGPVSNSLQHVIVPILSNAECRQTKYPARRITDNMMCAGYTDGGKDSCQGDSGGALHVIDGNIHKIVGVVSWGEGCAIAGYPGVYARVNRYITWIQRNTKDSCYC